MKIQSRLRIMLFLQYFIWGCWLITLSSYMLNTLSFTGYQVGSIYSVKGLAALIMPGLMGIVADKWMPANRVYAMCHGVCAVALFYAASISDFSILFWVMFANALAYMPTLALSNSITYSCLAKNQLEAVTHFPSIRVFGTVGFILAMWSISFFQLELSHIQLYIAAAASLILSVYSLTLPHIPIAPKTTHKSLASQMGLDAFVLFKQPRIAVFFLFAMLLGAILQVTNTFGGPFLHDFASMPQFADSLTVKYPAVLLSISQIAEVGFILTIPFFLKRLGIKTVILISMIAWTFRFGLFAFGDPSPTGFILLLLSMIFYGCAFDFFNISGSIFIEKEVDSSIRASAQGLYLSIVNGLGAYVGALISGKVVDYYTTAAGKDWQTIWLIFASYTFILAIAFFFMFKDKPAAKNGAKNVNNPMAEKA